MSARIQLEKIVLVKPFVPPIEELAPYLERIWASRQLTNGGPLHGELEKVLCGVFNVPAVSLTVNGTMALILSLKVLGVKGEVITTPFTSPATIQAILWNNLKPVYVDVREEDLNMDPTLIESAITPRTSAILPVHVFGIPCDTDAIGLLSRRYHLKVVYDAAHCFGVLKDGRQVSGLGDLSAISFHATKVFSTIEGGAILCHDEMIRERLESFRNTGIVPDGNLSGMGLNAKMNEIQAAIGLCSLKYTDQVIAGRKAATIKYRELLGEVSGLRLWSDVPGIHWNYCYFPVIIDPEVFGAERDDLCIYLREHGITTRKYFYPLVSSVPELKGRGSRNLPVASRAAKNIVCLPLYHDLEDRQIERITDLICRFRSIHHIGT